MAKSVSSGTTTRRDPRGQYPLYGSTGQIDRTSRREFTGPSILVARVGANAGSVYVVDGFYGVTDNTLVVRLASGHNQSFFAQYLELAELNRMVYGSGQPLVTGSMLKSLDVPVVDPGEQARVAAALDDVNDYIAALERLIIKKQAIKQGMVQQLLTGKTRLPGFTAEWKPTTIAARSVMKARIGWQGLKTDEYRSSGEYSLVGGTEFVDGRVDWGATPFVDKWRFDQDHHIQLAVGDVLLTKDGSIGKTAYVDSLPVPATLNSGVFVIRPVRDAYDSRFLYLMLRSRVFEDFLARLSAGSTISHLYQRDLVTLELELPPTLAEQRVIASAMFEAESEIVLLRQRLTKARAIKSGVMQQLLTGRVRLPVEDAE
ncbi:restriction endonuclease subunit S [Curtobacterium flaccumfaciens]|uniref:restriction endonuclease subunit S n=1 Tax=Curtobacterium flaccumfaciens TaxID=2035 RepID=UPI001AD9776A|nr:restriction endonuclease subunit S [Curtobacterium flaccumfaciens]MBO9044402.1 restriction endonuclease subunit S [Curtobacterium flaccumfaciens pv. flaccumfaciens]